MSDIYDAFDKAARGQGAAVGTRLRSMHAKEDLIARVRRGRRRRRNFETGLTAVALVLAGLGVVWLLPKALDQQPIVNDDVPRIEAGAFVCGEPPDAVPEPGVYSTAPQSVPELDLAMFSRWSDDLGEVRQQRIDLFGSRTSVTAPAVDPRAALGFAFQVLWGESGPPVPSWSVTTAAAVLDEQRTVVAVHDGFALRGDVMEVAEQRRSTEGLLSFAACGDPEPAGGHTLQVVVQVWGVEDGGSATTFVVESSEFMMAAGEEALVLTDDDWSRTLAGPETEAQLESEGVDLVETGVGVRATPGGVAARALGATLLCERAAVAEDGLAAIRVLPDVRLPSLEVSTGMVETPGEEALSSIGFFFPADGDAAAQMVSGTPDALLLFDSGGSLVSALAGDAELYSARRFGAEIAVNYFNHGDDCEVPAELPTVPGRYTAIYVWSDLGGLPNAIHGVDRNGGVPWDVWYRIPDVVVEDDGHVEPLLVTVSGGGWTMVG